MTASEVVYLPGKKNPKPGQMPYDLQMALCLFESVVCEQHIYKEVWMPRTGEELLVESRTW